MPAILCDKGVAALGRVHPSQGGVNTFEICQGCKSGFRCNFLYMAAYELSATMKYAYSIKKSPCLEYLMRLSFKPGLMSTKNI